MAHMTKFTRASVGHMAKHYERAKDAHGEYVKFSNQNIDIAKTDLNYNLAPLRNVNQGDFIRQRCGEIRMQNRKDVNVMASWVVTAPADLPERNHQAFFQASYNFLAARYGGEKNVISAYVHMDEVTPHIHFAFVPVAADQRRGGEKLSAKEVLTRRDLQTFHTDLSRHMERIFGRDVGILNEATKEGNKSIAELKRGTAVQEVAELTSKREAAAQEVAMLDAQYESVRDEAISLLETKNELLDEIDALRGQIKADTQEAALFSTQRTTVHREVISLKEQENALQGKIKGLRAQYSEVVKKHNEVVENHNSIVDESQALTANLEILRAAVKKESEAATASMGMGRMKERIAEMRQETEMRNRLSILEKFVKLPQINPLFEKFVQVMERGSGKSRSTEQDR